VNLCLPEIARTIDLMAPRVLKGGRVVYIGAGTSGRLGVLDASEIPPTFSAPYEQFIGLMAGGDVAIRKAVEGAEDSRILSVQDLSSILPPLDPSLDIVIGIASSGRTPYVLGGLQYARELGCVTIGVACVKPSSMRGLCECLIECVTGGEVVTGSTRLKAGTATKMILNMISTGTQIRNGKTYGNLMIDLKSSNEKLVDRARRIFRSVITASEYYEISQDSVVDSIIAMCDGSLKLALVVAKIGCSPTEGRQRLEAAGGVLRKVIK